MINRKLKAYGHYEWRGLQELAAWADNRGFSWQRERQALGDLVQTEPIELDLAGLFTGHQQTQRMVRFAALFAGTMLVVSLT